MCLPSVAGCFALHCACARRPTPMSLKCSRSTLRSSRCFCSSLPLVFLSLLLSKAVAKHIELVREQLQERCDALPL